MNLPPTSFLPPSLSLLPVLSSLSLTLCEPLSPIPPAVSGEFMVSPVEGELRVRRDVELDRETTPFYNLTVTALDLGTPPRNSTVGQLNAFGYTHL